MLVALTISTLIGFAGLGVKAGIWYTIKRQDQTAADFAAISGAYEIVNGSAYYVSATNSGICGLAARDAGRNGFSFVSFTSTPHRPARARPRAECAPAIHRVIAPASETTMRCVPLRAFLIATS